jgi:hypothetical protein
MERGDSWESPGWEADWEQPAADPDREQVLELARRLAEQHQRQSAEALVEVEGLKRALRERAADVARRELEVERRTRELDAHTHSEGRRTLRLRRPERPHPHTEDQAYAEELLTRREAEVQQRLAALAPREREVNQRETALRARELEIEEAEAALERRSQELESSASTLRDRERELEESRAEVSRTTDALVQRTVALEAAEQELAAERRRVQLEAGRGQGADEGATELAAQAHDLVKRAKEFDELERQLATREAKAAAAAERRHEDGEARKLAELETRVRAREAELIAREAELLRLQAGLAAQQESIRSRERALEDAERLRQREAALPAHPYISFSEGLEAFTGGRARSG